MHSIRLGHGKSVHAQAPNRGGMSLCGAGLWYGMGSRQYVNSTARFVDEQIDCKRCLAILNKRVNSSVSK